MPGVAENNGGTKAQGWLPPGLGLRLNHTLRLVNASKGRPGLSTDKKTEKTGVTYPRRRQPFADVDAVDRGA